MTRASRELLSEAEVQALLAAASERAPSGVRNRALVALLYCSGLRLSEALALRADELVLDAPTLAVRGTRNRTAQLFPAARPYLETWLALRAHKQIPGRQLFTTLAGEPLEPAYVRAMLARLARRAGLSKRVHAHLLRHSHAARLVAEGVGAEDLAAHLGHAAGRGARRALARFGVKGVLLTGSQRPPERRAAREALAEGQAALAFGTHALFSRDVRFARLDLVVIDEQQRFGVAQKQALLEKGADVHALL
ncbi:MAG: tyrosine-type recombinase/integrase, partial [Planctomycetota bacterium]